jgi:magnesium chelatase family protein
MNPCPAGRACGVSDCICTPDQQRRYRSRVSGPLLDRIDLRVDVPPISSEILFAAPTESTDTAQMRARIVVARDTQLGRAGKLNSVLTAPEIDTYCVLDRAGRQLIGRAMDRLGLSARGTHRVLKVARTLADLAGMAQITTQHLAEAIAFREVPFDY